MNDNNYKTMEPLDIPEAIIKTEGTIFGVLIKAHKLTHVKDNIYKSAGGRKYHLTKFGLESAVMFSAHEETRKIQKELEDVSENLVKARRKIEKLESRPNKDKLEAEVARLNQKVQNQAETLKRFHEEESMRKDTPKSRGAKNEQIMLLKGEMKMKNIEISELKKKLADKPQKTQKPQHATMPKVMVSKVTNNINAILSTPMPDSMKIKQIQTIIANP